jgi:tetratricopeptide (TPR) repeat protein
VPWLGAVVAEPVAFKYRAFLSYSHADTRWARRLHRQLEAFRIDKELAGRETSHGTIPRTLRPIFRDRDDFAAGHVLNDQTLAALDASAALIVLCSPAAAKSRYVNEEIRLFKSRHPRRPVIPVIVDGTPGDAEQECFAPALRFDVTADGVVTGTPAEVVAADVRENGDGADLALAKVVARLLDLSTDDVFRRAERERRRSATIRNAIIAILALLTVAAMGSAAYAWQQLKTNQAFLEATLKRATEIVNTAVAQAEKYNVPRTATLELLTRAEGLFDDMARLGRPTPALQRQKAWMLIEFARNYEILGDTTKQRERSEEAVRIMAALAIDNNEDPTALRDLSIAHEEQGRVFVAQGNLPAALESYNASFTLRERLAEAEPDNRRRQQEVYIALWHLADVEIQQGKLADALTKLERAKGITQRLAESDSNNPEWQRDLSVCYNKIGDVLTAQGNLSEALKAYHADLVIAERLAKTDPNNITWQRDLSVSYAKVGEVLDAQDNLPEALKSYQASLAITERLAKTDPNNVVWQSDLAAGYSRLASIHRKAGERERTLGALTIGRSIMQRLVALAPSHVDWKRDLEWFDRQIAALDPR